MQTIKPYILNHLNVAIIVTDSKQLICDVNTSAETIMGFSSRQLIGTCMDDWLESSDFSIKSLSHALFKGKQFHKKNALLHLVSGKSIRVDIFIKLISIEEQNFQLIEFCPLASTPILMVDEKELDRHRQTQKLISNLAHEIRNPLGGLKGAAQLLEKKISVEDKVFTDLIIREANRMNVLIERVLGPAKAEAKRLFNIHLILEEVVQLIQLDLPRNIQIIKDYDPSLPDFLGLRSGCFQALLNLVRNSVQALSMADRENFHPLIRLRTRVEHGIVIGEKFHRLALKLEVIDNGFGVPDEIKETLFMPMVSGNSEGTGLGLSLARAFIEKQGGILQWSESHDETRFAVYLPLIRSE